MKPALREKRIAQFFRVSLWLKGIHAGLEIISGVLLIFLSPVQVTRLVILMTQDELVEDPNDLIANYLLNFATQISISSILFGAFYLLSHGIFKLTLIIALLKRKLWAYPWSLILFSLMIVYQIYRFSYTHSIGLFILTVFDLIVIWLIWHEYKLIKKHTKI
jgi:uncharacterized membrane protein